MTFNIILPEVSVAETLERFDRAGVEWRRWWGLGCHKHPAFAHAARTDLSATDRLAQTVIGVPFHTMLTGEDIDRVVECVGTAP